jgi:hypothetical protein
LAVFVEQIAQLEEGRLQNEVSKLQYSGAGIEQQQAGLKKYN